MECTVSSRVLTRITNHKIIFLSKGHTVHKDQKSPPALISNLKKPACASKQDVLELATLRYLKYRLHGVDFTKVLGCHSPLNAAERKFMVVFQESVNGLEWCGNDNQN